MTEQQLKKKNHFLTANLMYMLLAVAFIVASLIMGTLKTPFKLTIIIIQYGIILIPIYLVMKWRGVPIKQQFRFNKISLGTGIKALAVTLFSLPLAWTLNFLLNYILVHLGIFQVQTMELGSGTGNYFIILFLVAITPGICEEFFFRGMMFTGYEQAFNKKQAIIMTGILFGLFHFNLQNLLLPTFLGMVFAWMVYTTNSIYTSMLGHTLFNAIGATTMYMQINGPKVDVSVEETISVFKEQGAIVLVVLGVVSIISTLLMIAVAKSMKEDAMRIEPGDTLIIHNNHLQVLALEGEDILIEDNQEQRVINRLKLDSYAYKHIKGQTQVLKSKGTRSKWNVVFVGIVVIMYTILMLNVYL